MIRVLHLINSLNVGGLEKRLVQLLHEIPRDVVAMDFACKAKTPGGVMAPTAEELGATVYHCRFSPFHVGFVRGLARILRQQRYDIVHNHLGSAAGLPVWVARREGVRVISSFVSTHPWLANRWGTVPGFRQALSTYARFNIRYAVEHSDMVTGVSSAVLDALVPDHQSRTNCLVVHSGVRANVPATPEDCRALRVELGLPPECPLVLHIGRFTWEKNHRGVLSVFQRVLNARPDARLLLVGVGPQLAEIEREVANRNLQGQVQMLGLRLDVPRLMRCANVLLMPSVFEGLPVVALEALASRLPIVFSNIPGVAGEVIVNDQTGRLHAVDDLDGMARSVLEILNDPALARRLAENGLETWEREFSLRAAAARNVELYQRCMAKDNSSAVLN